MPESCFNLKQQREVRKNASKNAPKLKVLNEFKLANELDYQKKNTP